MTETEIRAASRSTLNAHYTSPAIAEQMWRVLAATLGDQPATVYEPGVGTGVFIAHAPATVTMVGVELDPMTARLAQRLHPNATIHHQSLTDHQPPPGGYDAAIGNVPFADTKPYDPIDNPERRLSLHNLAIVKALNAVKPGGAVTVITSSFTLDAANPGQRIEIARRGDLQASLRLPDTAFWEQSGTRVVTDILMLQRHDDGRTRDVDEVLEESPPWLHVDPIDLDDTTIHINRTYHDHPERVLGTLASGGMYSTNSLTVIANDEPLHPTLKAATTDLLIDLALAEPATREPQSARPQTTRTPAFEAPTSPEPPPWLKPGGIYGNRAVGFRRRPDDGGPDEPYQPTPKKDARVLELVCQLRDTYVQLTTLEADPGASVADIESVRGDLNQIYDRATAINGPLTAYTTSTTKTGSEVRRYRPLGGFRRDDPDYAIVLGLETYNPDTQTASRSAIFTERQLNPPARHVCETIEDAVGVALHTAGSITAETIAELLNITADQATSQLATAAFRVPGTDEWVDPDTYLSGNVRAKHATAVEAAATDPAYQPNVEALADVIPDDIPIEEIKVQLGAPWLTGSEYKQFLEETVGVTLNTIDIRRDKTLGWVIGGRTSRYDYYDAATSTWGTDRINAIEITARAIRGDRIVVYDTDAEGRRYINQSDTVEANQKLDELNVMLSEWVQHEDRADALERRYNDTYNSHVAPRHQHHWPHPPGLVNSFTLRSHQAAAVKRFITTRSLGLFHQVGAGKTLTMATAAI